jgi:SAM-dependent methyltransferase
MRTAGGRGRRRRTRIPTTSGSFTTSETGTGSRASSSRTRVRDRIVDVGCGHGLALAAFARIDPALRLKGYDDSAAALARAARRDLLVDRLDIMGLSKDGAAALAADLRSFDLAICLEVAEHLPSWHAGKLMAIVSASRRLVFSAAHPSQGGRLHVNERPASYWIARLSALGMRLAPDDADFRRAVAALDLPAWYGQNVHLFERDVTRS